MAFPLIYNGLNYGDGKVKKEFNTMLVFGGARSGKSAYAQETAEQMRPSQLYVATAEAYDDEMRDRIQLHQDARGTTWTTLEESLNIADVIRNETRPNRVVMIDCLTLWLSNIMGKGLDLKKEYALLSDSLQQAQGPVILVSNETGFGIVPENALARQFRDEQGRLNQVMAKVCDKVVLVVAGLPLFLKE